MKIRSLSWVLGVLGLAVALALPGCGGGSSSTSSASGAVGTATTPAGGLTGPSSAAIFSTTKQYVEQFYPLWISYHQWLYTNLAGSIGTGPMAGPDKVSPVYQIVVAINVDTLYASSFLSLTPTQAVVLTIPSTSAHYSTLVLDPYGNILSTSLPDQTPGTFCLTGPGFSGTVPAGMTQVQVPSSFVNVIFRADLYSSTGVNMGTEAAQFRAGLLCQSLSGYMANPAGGASTIVPEAFFVAGFKVASDTLVTKDSINYLKQLQVSVASSNTPPLNADQQALVNQFNALFGTGDFASGSEQGNAFIEGAQAGYNAIVNNYLNNLGPTNWINFTNIGQWGNNFLDRSSIAEYIQYANNFSAAAYFQTFKDANGGALDGSKSNYVLTFPKNLIPQASRFWSVTAYTPDSVELIKNSIDKYAVASYTPGLVTNPDGSISITMAAQQPAGVPTANWLPVSSRPFNIMLRVYGPEGSVANQTYVPPPVVKSN